MLETLLKNNTLGQWLQGGPENDVVLSSRVRLARNIAGYPFLSRAKNPQIARIERFVRSNIEALDRQPPLTYHQLDGMESLTLLLLVERHIIPRDFAETNILRGVAFSEEEDLSIMVNEEDHLRIQVVGGGLRLAEVSERAHEIDDVLAEKLPYAFSADYGYLTVCPTNVGTGMRASVMVHLPAIIMRREMDKLTRICDDLDLALRGLYGEGTHGSADIYQISNNKTLGLSEEDVVELVHLAARQIIELERNTRESIMALHKKELAGRINKAFHLLCDAVSISSEEALSLLSQVRMGVNLGLLENLSKNKIDKLLLLTLPAHLQIILGRESDRVERNKMRASYIREHLILNQKHNTREA